MPKKKPIPELVCQNCGYQMVSEILWKDTVDSSRSPQDIAHIVVSCKCGSPRIKGDRDLYATVVGVEATDKAFSYGTIVLNTLACPSVCPICGEGTSDYDSVDVEDEVASQAGSCPSCGSEWTEHYRISSRVITLNGQKKKK